MIVDGKKIAGEILNETKTKIEALQQAQGKSFRFAAILVEGNQLAESFLKIKQKAAEKIGVDFRIYKYPENISTSKLRKEVISLSKAKVNTGVIVELPLPKHLNTQHILNAIPETKDIDVLSQKSFGAFIMNRSKILPPVVEAVKVIFDKFNVDVKGKNVAVFGYGQLVGKPIAHWLLQNMATVIVINEFTKDPASLSKSADIIISGVGKPGLITADMVKNGATVIDFGYEEGSGLGDIDFDAVVKKASLITPVPGGMGPIVVASLFKNLLKLSNTLDTKYT